MLSISIILLALRTLRVKMRSQLRVEGVLEVREDVVEVMVEEMFGVVQEEMLVEMVGMEDLREVVVVHLEVYEVIEIDLVVDEVEGKFVRFK